MNTVINTVVTMGDLQITWEQIKSVLIWVFVGSGIIELAPPIKVNPWSWVLQKIGNVINDTMYEKISKIEDNIEDLSKKVGKLEDNYNYLQEEGHKWGALESRRRILSFSDKIRRDIKFSEEHYDNILWDINSYNTYCQENPKFENEKTVIAQRVIMDKYKHCIEENDFL